MASFLHLVFCRPASLIYSPFAHGAQLLASMLLTISAQTPQGIEHENFLEVLVFDMEDERLEELRWNPDFWIVQFCGQKTEGGARP